MNISYDRNQMDLVVEFLRNANSAAERYTPEGLRDRIEESMRSCIAANSWAVSTLGFTVLRFPSYDDTHSFEILVDLAVCIPSVLTTVRVQ